MVKVVMVNIFLLFSVLAVSCDEDYFSQNELLSNSSNKPRIGPQYQEDSVFKGSFWTSCNKVHFEQGILSAHCEGPNGQNYPTQFKVNGCKSFKNVYGRLRCEHDQSHLIKNGPQKESDYLILGSFWGSCTDVHYVDGIVHAKCSKLNGSYMSTMIEFKKCEAFANIVGNLMCQNDSRR